MKISTRILFINLSIVVLILVGSSIAFYTIVFNILKNQQTKYLLNSTNQLLYNLQSLTQRTDETFETFLRQNRINFAEEKITKEKYLDFIYEVKNDSLIHPNEIIYSESVNLPKGIFSIKEFLQYNPNAVIRSYRTSENHLYNYGILLNSQILDNISTRINADVAVFIDNILLDFSNSAKNQKYFYSVNKAYRNLLDKSNFELYTENTSSSFLTSSICKIKDISSVGQNINALVFSTSTETVNLNKNILILLIILGFASAALSVILSVLFTGKLRRQINLLSNATEITSSGDFKTRLSLNSKDELGELAKAFNKMLDELEKQEKSKIEYAEFLSLINQNPNLKSICDAALEKIIQTCKFDIGAVYYVEDSQINLISSYGIKSEMNEINSINLTDTNTKINNEEEIISNNFDFFSQVIKKNEPLEFTFKENAPKISSGIISIELKYLLIYPIIYNNKTIALIELGSVNIPNSEAKEYLNKIKEQLALGIVNASTLMKLENLVIELKKLNNDYQKQNIQIKQQNEKLLELHNQLVEKANELEIQKKRAEELTEIKSRFLALISHELRTPLNSILGLTELVIEDKSFSAKNKERLSVILKSGKRLVNLINDLLDFSKIEAGKMEIHYENFLLEDLLNEIKLSIKPLADNKNLKFRIIQKFLTDDGISRSKIGINNSFYISTDRAKLFQVILNLLSNAVKFTEKGFVELVVDLTDDNKLIFEVNDSGIGIPEGDLNFIFEEFVQVDSSNTRRYSGTGLGLAICKRIIELLNGKISVESQIGKGSKFKVEIPITIIRDKIIDDKSLIIDSKDKLIENEFENINTNIYLNENEFNEDEYSSKNNGNVETILIVDDDADSLFTMNEIVQKGKYNSVLAKDGLECLDILEKQKIDLVLLDIMMPVMDGFQTIKRIKEKKNLADIPVLAVSAKAMIDDRKIIYKYGFEGFIGKPINPNMLISTIRRILKQNKKRNYTKGISNE